MRNQTKVGWFHKEENRSKIETFIKDYINEHFEDALKEEFGMSDK